MKRNKNILMLFVFSIILISSITSVRAVAYTAVTNGSWEDNDTWGVASGYPKENDTATLNHTIWINTTSACKNTTIQSGGHLIINASTNFTIENVDPNTGDLTISPGAYLIFEDTGSHTNASIIDSDGWLFCQGNSTDYAHIISEVDGGTNMFQIGVASSGATKINMDFDYCEIKDCARFYPYGTNFTADNVNFTHIPNMLIRDINVNLTNLNFNAFSYSAYKLYLYNGKVNINGLNVYPVSQLTRFLRVQGGPHEVQNGNLDHRDTTCRDGSVVFWNMTRYYGSNPTTYYVYVNDSMSISEDEIKTMNITDGKTLFIGAGWIRRDGTGYEQWCGGTFVLNNSHFFNKIRIADGILDAETNDVEIKVNESFKVNFDGYFNASSTVPLKINDSSNVLLESFLDLKDVLVQNNSNITITSNNVTYQYITLDEDSYMNIHQNIDYDSTLISTSHQIAELDLPSADFPFTGTSFTNANNPQTVITLAKSLNETVHPSVVYFETAWNGYRWWMANTPYPAGLSNKGEHENPSMYVCSSNCENENGIWEAPPGISNPIDDCNMSGAECSDADLIYNNVTDQLEIYYRWTKDGTTTMRRRTSPDGITWSTENNCSNQVTSQSIYFDGSTYTMWGVNTTPMIDNDRAGSYYLDRYTSTNGINWTMQGSIRDEDLFIARSPWHPKVRYIEEFDEFWMIASCSPGGGKSGGGGNGNLWFARSKDGIIWYNYEEVALDHGGAGQWDTDASYRTDFRYDADNYKIKIWYAGLYNTAPRTWNLGYTEAVLRDEYAPEETDGTSTGGGSQGLPDTENNDFNDRLCNLTYYFLKEHPNPTYDEVYAFKKEVGELFGYPVSILEITEYVEHFKDKCPDYKLPEEITDEALEKILINNEMCSLEPKYQIFRHYIAFPNDIGLGSISCSSIRILKYIFKLEALQDYGDDVLIIIKGIRTWFVVSVFLMIFLPMIIYTSRNRIKKPETKKRKLYKGVKLK